MTELIKSYLWVALGSAIGGVSRFWLSGLVAGSVRGTFPWGTVIVNITGSFVIGVFAGLASPEGRLAPATRTWVTQFLMVGICGGYTTFSSFSLQTLNLARDGEWLQAGGNVLVSVAACLAAVWAGYALAEGLSK